MDPAIMEEKSKLVSSRIQKETAYKVIIKNYAYLVEHVDAIRIFPQLVASKLVEQDLRQRLEHRETEKEKMMALLQALTRCTEETWFDGFTNALSKVPQYEKVTGTLLEDFKNTLAERMTNPTEEESSKDAPALLHDDGAPVVNVTVSGVDEVMKKAMEDAQVAMKETIKDAKEAMKEARRDHSKALSALTKANDRVLEAEKGKVRAEAEKRDLEMTVHEVGRKLSESEAKLREADDKLREAEVHKQLLEVEFELKLNMKEDNATSAIRVLEGELGEAERNKKKLDEMVRGLKEELEKNHTEHAKVQERQEEVVRKLKEELEKNHAEQAEAQEKQDEVVRGLKEELEKTLTEQAEAQEKQDEVVRGLKEELERTLAERAELQERQEQKVSELVKKLEASNSDRDSMAKKYQDAEGDLETVKSELAQTQAEGKKLEVDCREMKQKLEQEVWDKEVLQDQLAELQQKYRDNLEQLKMFQERHAKSDVTKAYSTPDDRLRQAEAERRRISNDLFDMRLLSSTTLEDYRVNEVVAQGNDGVVLKVTCMRPYLTERGKMYALKGMINYHKSTTLSRVRDQFRCEYEVLCKLPLHDNIIRLHAFFFDRFDPNIHPSLKDLPGARSISLFLVMDYHPTSMEVKVMQLFNQQGPKPKEVLNWCLQLLTALEFLDAHCVVHRDLKLSNLMLTSQGVLKVTDFGQAVQLGKDMTIPFMSGMYWEGNKSHQSPEILTARPGLNRYFNYKRFSVWAAGVLAFEMAGHISPFLTGQVDQEDYSTFELSRLTFTRSRDHMEASRLPPRFTNLVWQMLEYSWEKRLSIRDAFDEMLAIVDANP